MSHCYPYVPVGGEMALNCAILTYDGTAYFGFSGDVHAVPDLRRLETLLQSSFVELREAAGLRPTQKEEKKKIEKRVRAKAKVKLASTSPPMKVPVRAPVQVPPVASTEPVIQPRPPVMEEKVLTQLIA
jgi:D-aminopeptidase